jgi:hypothetical protein
MEMVAFFNYLFSISGIVRMVPPLIELFDTVCSSSCLFYYARDMTQQHPAEAGGRALYGGMRLEGSGVYEVQVHKTRIVARWGNLASSYFLTLT